MKRPLLRKTAVAAVSFPASAAVVELGLRVAASWYSRAESGALRAGAASQVVISAPISVPR